MEFKELHVWIAVILKLDPEKRVAVLILNLSGRLLIIAENKKRSYDQNYCKVIASGTNPEFFVLVDEKEGSSP